MKKGIIILLCLISTFVMMNSVLYIQLLPKIKQYGKMEIERFNQLIISHSYLTDQSQYDNLVIIERNDQKEIQLIDFDMIKINKIANDIVMDMETTYASIENGTYHAKDETHYQKRLEDVSKTGIISKVSIGSLLHVPFFQYLTPSISIRYKHLSQVSASIRKSVNNYGLNHIMVELNIEVTINLTMVYPFFEQYHSHTITIPILLEIFQGQIPLVYSQ